MSEHKYFAGLMDGEGSWSIQVTLREQNGRKSVHFNPRMTMGLLHGNEVLDEMVELYGGKVYDYANGMRKWSLGKRAVMEEATRQLLPHLKIKKEIAARFLDAMETFPKTRKQEAGNRSWTPDMIEKVGHIALTLNPAGSGKSEKTLELIEEIKSIYADET